jgi:hypothetical protein
MKLHRRHKANKRSTVTKARTTRPEVILGGVFRVDSGLKVVYCLLAENNKDGRKQLKRFCHANGLHADFCEDGWAAVTGTDEDLMRLPATRYWANPLIREWHWMSNAHVSGGSGAGETPKRTRSPRFVPTSRQGEKDLQEMAKADEAHQ